MVPFAAVTVTETVLVPATRPVRPEITNLASASWVVASTETEVVPAATMICEMVSPSTPPTVKTERLLFALKAATRMVTA